ncbi:MAG: hypothetical protein FJW21_04885 [Acidimicrobiia bacterium]|nr:hypothetical protein [Acidimicrobiia bacterium]
MIIWVVVKADQTVLSRAREYLDLIAIGNTQISRFAEGQRRGTVNLRVDPVADAASVEYCLRRCTEHNAEVVRYESTLDAFLRKLDAQSDVPARRKAPCLLL